MSCVLALFTAALATAITPQTKAKFVYGDEGFGRETEEGPHVQVIDDPAGDTYEIAPTTQGGDKPSRFRKWAGVIVRIKGASSKSGATLADHRGLVEALADVLVISLPEVAHAHKLNVRSITGAVVEKQDDDLGTNPASAYYQIRFQLERPLNKKKSLEILAADIENGVIAHRMIVPLTEGAWISAFVGDVATISGLSGIDASFVGKTLTLAGGEAEGNRGDFPIASVIDATSVTITNANASIDTGLTWAVSEDEPAQTT